MNCLGDDGRERNGAPFDEMLYFREELIEHRRFGSDDIGLVTVTSRQVLRGDDAHLITGFRLDEQHLRVVVREMGGCNHLFNEAPQVQRLVRGLEIQNQVNCRSLAVASDEVQSAKELLRD